jgi:hypothetical protein
MADPQAASSQPSGQALREQGTPAVPALSLEQSLQALVKQGGFDLLEVSIDGLKNLNPARKALKRIFLTDASKKAEREALKKRLGLWIGLLSDSANISEMAEKAASRAVSAGERLATNLKVAVDASRQLESAYRSVALFYNNASSDKIKNITILNAAPDNLQDLDGRRFVDYVSNELKQNYDRLDLRDNYSLMVIPGYLGSPKVVDTWSRMAHENKVMLVTDFQHLDNVDDVIGEFEASNLSGGDVYKSNTIMTCNWIVGRARNEAIGEEDDLMVPPSSALAGKMYTTLMSQVTAGKTYGALNEVDTVSFDMKKSDIAKLDKIGVVPLVNEYGKVMAFSAKTLFNGDNIGLQTYSVVRVFDYINKSLVDFLNRRAFENWTSKTEKELRRQIVEFLDRNQGPDRLIEKFRIDRFERDDNQKDRIYLDINITPYFPAKSFMLKLDGTKGDNGTSWNTKTE